MPTSCSGLRDTQAWKTCEYRGTESPHAHMGQTLRTHLQPLICKWRHRSQEGEWLAQGYVTCLGGAGSRVALPWGPWHCPPIASTSKAFLLLRQAMWGHLQTSWQKWGWARRPMPGAPRSGFTQCALHPSSWRVTRKGVCY